MSGENHSDKKFWKNMAIMLVAKVVFVGVSVVLIVDYNAQFYA